MQIKIEIDVRPDELRRFLGLPDVSGLQDDVVAFLRDKLDAAGEFDASGFVKQNLDLLRKTPAWQKIAARIRIAEEDAPPAPKSPARAAPRKRSPRKTAAKADRGP